MRKLNKLWAIALTLLMALSCFVACDKKEDPPHVHVTTLVEAKSAGYATHGNEVYYECSCGKLFEDQEATKETTLNDVIIRSETGFDKQTYTKNNYTLNYCLYEPEDLNKSEDKVPLILFLHGAGERGSNNEWQLKLAIQKVIKAGNESSAWMNSVVIAPQCPSSTGGNTNSNVDDPNKWAETPWTEGNYVQADVPESKPLKAAAELVQQYAGYDYIDESRVYVIGLSMGGFGTWDILAHYPDLFAAGVPICGGGPTDKIDVLKNIPIYTFHGTADASVPYTGTQAMFNAISAAGGKMIKFYTFNGASHWIWDQAITFAGSGTQYPALETWLFSQQKGKPAPDGSEIPPFNYSAEGRLEAEDAIFTNCTMEQAQKGVNTGINITNTSKNSTVTLNILANKAVTTELYMYAAIKVDDTSSSYSSTKKDRISVTVNNNAIDYGNEKLTGTTDDTWRTKYGNYALGEVNLVAGRNTIVITLSECVNIDFFCFDAPAFSVNYSEGAKIEAEETNYTSGKQERTGTATILGSMAENTSLTFHVVADEATTTELLLNSLIHVEGNYSGNAAERFTLTVNGVAVDLSSITITGVQGVTDWYKKTYSLQSLGNINLKAGENVIVLTIVKQHVNPDYIQLGTVSE